MSDSSFDISTVDIIKAFRDDGYRVTAYDHGNLVTVKFCLGIILQEAIDIWYVHSSLCARDWDIGAPCWDDHNMTIYFPAVTLDKESYEVLFNDKG